MKLKISAVGKLKSGPEAQLFDRYLVRARRSGVQLGFSNVILHEISESRSSNARQRKSEEATQILSAAGNNAVVFAFDENGEDLTSVQFSRYLATSRDNGIGEMVFCLGGPDGHGRDLLFRANKIIRLGRMTWPHQIARILLMEQIYRAMTMLAGHPYHRS